VNTHWGEKAVSVAKAAFKAAFKASQSMLAKAWEPSSPLSSSTAV